MGCDTVEELEAWRAESAARGEPWIMRTRQTPRQTDDLLDGGSLFRVYRGQILSRQQILGVATVGSGPARRCEVTLGEEVVRTLPTPRRAFQGWRYLKPADAPPDLENAGNVADAPPELVRRLRELGAW